jgi:protein-S-isoprenylcysteine O-methyltransferase Ste14
MYLKILIIVIFTYSYGIFELYNSIRQKHRNKNVKTADKGSLIIMFIGISIAYLFAFYFAFSKYGTIYSKAEYFYYMGIVLIVSGIFIRINSILTLSKHFTYAVRIGDKHELIEKGFYKIIRHPGYLGQFMLFAGIGMALMNWISLISMILPIIIVYSYRINVEEKAMIAHFGQKYLEYMKRTKRIIPWIF